MGSAKGPAYPLPLSCRYALRVREDSVRLGALKIWLPSAGRSYCYIFHDLAELLGVECNGDAAARLEAEWKRRGKRGRLDLDYEADFVSIHAGRDAIVEAALLIHELAVPDVPRPTDEEVARVRATIKQHKRPAPALWEVGDVFAAPLADGTFIFGQVLWEPVFEKGAGVRAPTVSLLEYRLPRPDEVDIDEVVRSRTLAILHVQSHSLAEGRWRVVGRRPVTSDPFGGPCGRFGAVGSVCWDGLEILANAWYGLEPWNQYFRPDHLDQYLMKGVSRPASARMLSADERGARGLPAEDDAAYKLYARQRG